MVKTRQRDAELSLAHTELLRSTKYMDESLVTGEPKRSSVPHAAPAWERGVDSNTSYRIRQERPRVTMIGKAQ